MTSPRETTRYQPFKTCGSNPSSSSQHSISQMSFSAAMCALPLMSLGIEQSGASQQISDDACGIIERAAGGSETPVFAVFRAIGYVVAAVVEQLPSKGALAALGNPRPMTAADANLDWCTGHARSPLSSGSGGVRGKDIAYNGG